MRNLNSDKIGFYTKGTEAERDIQISHLLCYAMLENIESGRIVYYEDEDDFSSLHFLFKNPIISTLVMYNEPQLTVGEGKGLIASLSHYRGITVLDIAKNVTTH